jgi:hypothetical protein
MAKWKNKSRLEKFAMYLAEDWPCPEAYQKAGYAYDESNSYKAANKPWVKERVRTLRDLRKAVEIADKGGTDLDELKLGIDGLRHVARLAVEKDQLTAAANAFNSIAKADGSADAANQMAARRKVPDIELAGHLMPILRRALSELKLKPRSDEELLRVSLACMNNPVATGYAAADDPIPDISMPPEAIEIPPESQSAAAPIQ